MHAPSLHHKWHPLDVSATFIEHHHKIAEVLLVLIILGMLSTLANRFEMLRAFDTRRAADLSRVAAENAAPLTRLTDPANAREYAQRTAYIMTRLDRLRESGQNDRAYIVVYEYAPSKMADVVEPQVFASFEARAAQIAPRFENVERMSRDAWLQMLSNQEWGMNFAPLSNYGAELYNEQEMPIGYIGIERDPGKVFLESEMTRFDASVTELRTAAAQIEQVLLLPLDTLTQP